jgi:transcriptional regulator with XRE-family HTH domain
MVRNYLIDLRIKKDYSQRKVAYESGMSYQHYSNLESGARGGKVSLLIMGRIARTLEISLDDLYVLEEQYQNKIQRLKEKEEYER